MPDRINFFAEVFVEGAKEAIGESESIIKEVYIEQHYRGR